MYKIKNLKYLKHYYHMFLILLMFIIIGNGHSIMVTKAAEDDNFNAVWISYLEFASRLKDSQTGKIGFSETRFIDEINTMFDNVVDMGMNAVVVHVRPYGDALYPSKYFPWSQYISGIQGKNPGFDPLEIMIEAAHERDLEFHAWFNPYRVATNTTNVNKLAKDNKARIWLTDKNKNNDRNVLKFNNALYFNPAKKEVRDLIYNGIIEIIENYNVDGIHFDDYFYPTLGKNHSTLFDYKEYNSYKKTQKAQNKKVLKIADWRRNNVNKLIKSIYSGIKDLDEDIVFGISPGGFYDSLLSDLGHYCDIITWLSKPGYIDYICPQLYWTFDHKYYPFDKTLDQWIKYKKNDDVKLYVGMAIYRAGSNLEPAWKKDVNILKNQVKYALKTEKVDGFIHFRYDSFFEKTGIKARNNMLDLFY